MVQKSINNLIGLILARYGIDIYKYNYWFDICQVWYRGNPVQDAGTAHLQTLILSQCIPAPVRCHTDTNCEPPRACFPHEQILQLYVEQKTTD